MCTVGGTLSKLLTASPLRQTDASGTLHIWLNYSRAPPPPPTHTLSLFSMHYMLIATLRRLACHSDMCCLACLQHVASLLLTHTQTHTIQTRPLPPYSPQAGDALALEWGRGRVFDADVGALLAACVRDAGCLRVSGLSTKEERRGRPAGLNTVELLKVASSYLNIGPAHALQVCVGGESLLWAVWAGVECVVRGRVCFITCKWVLQLCRLVTQVVCAEEWVVCM